MGSLPLAFSVHHYISSVGADAGFAAIIGLAILVLLYFAQARETANLREQAYQSAQRVQELEARLAQVSPRQGAAAPAPAPAAVRAAAVAAGASSDAPAVAPAPPSVAAQRGQGVGRSRMPSRAPVPGAAGAPVGAAVGPPAGVGAPALAAATKLIPTGADAAPAEAGRDDTVFGMPAPAVQVPAEPVAAEPVRRAVVAQAAAPQPVAVAGGLDAAATDATAFAAPPPATAAARANGQRHGLVDPSSVHEPVSAVAVGVTEVAVGAAAVEDVPAPAGASTPVSAAASSGDVAAPLGDGGSPSGVRQRPASAPPRRTGARAAPRSALSRPRTADRRSGISRGVAAILIGGLVGAIVAGLLLATSLGGSRSAAKTGIRTTNAPAPSTTHHPAKRTVAPAPAFNPSSVTVAVLNGTAATGLAHRTSVRLASAGYKQGNIATASNQTETATVVAYLPGHRSDALQVASTLKLASASVQPVDQDTQAVACPPPSACTALVIVTVGQDLAAQ